MKIGIQISRKIKKRIFIKTTTLLVEHYSLFLVLYHPLIYKFGN